MLTGAPPVRVGNELYLYYRGLANRHKPYDGKDDAFRQGGGLGLATLRVDGFASLDASYDGGRVTTKPFRTQGRRLHVNAKADSGRLRVEVLDNSGHAFSGFGRDDCQVMQVNRVNEPISWKDNASLDSLNGYSADSAAVSSRKRPVVFVPNRVNAVAEVPSAKSVVQYSSAGRLAGSGRGRFDFHAAANLADRLAEPVRVLDDRQAEIAFAVFAEAAAGADGHARFVEQLHREVDRAHRSHGSGIFAQTNMPALGGSMSQPWRSRPSHRTSRRSWYSAARLSIAASQCRMATMAAIWIGWKMP